MNKKVVKVEIYQLPIESNYIFMNYNFAEDKFNFDDYNLVYETERETDDVKKLLDDLFVEFNCNRPSDFKGHSMSISDLIKIDDKIFYVNDIGFMEIKDIF